MSTADVLDTPAAGPGGPTPPGPPDSGGRGRRRRRRGDRPGAGPRRRMSRAALLSLIAGGLILLVSAYAMGVYWLLGSSKRAADVNDTGKAISRAEAFLVVSPFERHKGHFNVGTAEAMQSNLDVAQTRLERALELTPVADECAVRHNLAFVYEQQALEFQQADNVPEANAKFDASRTTLQDAPEECRPDGGSQDEAMDEAEERVDEAQEEMNNPSESSGEEEGSEGEESEEESGDDGEESEGSGGGSEEDEDDGSEGSGDELEGQSGGDEEEQGSGGSSQQERKREELRKRTEDSKQRQDEAESRDRSDYGSGSGRPW